MAAKIPNGTLTKKSQCQPNSCVSTPPRSTPAAAPPEATILQTLRARLRSGPSLNVVSKTDIAAGDINAAVRPCSARNTINDSLDWESPISSDVAVKPISPVSSTFRRPNKSAALPPSSKNPPNVNTYAVRIHCKDASVKPSDSLIAGRATFTIELSSTTKNCVSASNINTIIFFFCLMNPPRCFCNVIIVFVYSLFYQVFTYYSILEA